MSNSMYCHACHHQWQCDSDAIECPACRSASTEIITPENDPRHFHNPQPDEAASAVPPAAPIPADSQAAINSTAPNLDQEMTDAPAAEQANGSQDSGNTQNGGRPGAERRPEVVFVFPPPMVTFFTTVVTDTHVPPPDAAGPRGPPVTTHFSLNLFPNVMPRAHPTPATPSSTQTSNPPTGTESPSEQTSQPGEQQQNATPNSPPRPATGAPPAGFNFLELLLGSMFGINPANATFGDAVFSQEALDRIITQLREQNGPGGAPPASQSAIDKLEVKELDEKMLGGENKSRCVICVDEMSVGEKASVLPCSHFFHGECVTPWLKQHNTCPVCRRSIEPEPVKLEKAAQFAHNEHEADQPAPSTQDCS